MTETTESLRSPARQGRLRNVAERLGRVHIMALSDRRLLWGERGLRLSHIHIVGYVALVAAALWKIPEAAGIALLFAAVAEAGGILLPRYSSRSRTEWRSGLDRRARLRVLLFIMALAAADAPGEAIVAFVSLAVAVLIVSHAMLSPLLHLNTTRLLRPLGSLEAGAERMNQARKLARRRDIADLPLHGSLLVAGFLLTVGVTERISMEAAIGAGAVAVLLAVGLAGWVAVACRALRPELLLKHDDEVLAAFREFDPQVICYFNGHPGSLYAVEGWLRTFENCGWRVALVFRHQSVSTVGTDLLPGLVVPNDAAIENIVSPSTRIVLYPANSTLNVHLQRDKRVSHVFIGHGDSDKAGSASPYTRSYDEVWVSGKAAIDRYTEAGIKIPEERFVRVGRPPLSPKVRAAEIDHRVRRYAAEGRPDPVSLLNAELLEADGGAGKPTTILFAPTWEGYFDDSDYSSLESLGMELIEMLLSRFPECRVVYKPHPMTGHRKRELRAVSRSIRDLLAKAPVHNPSTAEHAEVDLQTWFDQADLLIADVSSVVSDFLAWDRPYVVTNPFGLSIEELRRRFPTTAAAYVIESGSPAMPGIIASALQYDPLRPRRIEAKRYLLGDDEVDALDQFAGAIGALYDSMGPRSA